VVYVSRFLVCVRRNDARVLSYFLQFIFLYISSIEEDMDAYEYVGYVLPHRSLLNRHRM
jgi:hypothetical protein